MQRCIVKFDEKTENKKIQRWQKISETASKQCGRNIIPKINNVIKLKNICNLISNYDIVLVAYENEKLNILKNELKKLQKKDNIAVIIGPEGGLEPKEIDVLKQSRCKSSWSSDLEYFVQKQ